VATGTAMYVRGLPAPPSLKVFRNLDVLDEEDKQLLEIQRKITQQSENNRKLIETALMDIKAAEGGEENTSDSESSASSDLEDGERGMKRNLRSNTVVQIDDEQDEDLVLLMDPVFSDGFTLCNTELPPFSDSLQLISSSYNIQMITVVKQSSINLSTRNFFYLI
jgi:hypothetical protein